MPLNKKSNEYARSLSPEFFSACPKAVFAALAVSYAGSGGDALESAQANLINEWWVLFDNGIVPQKPPFPRVDEGASA